MIVYHTIQKIRKFYSIIQSKADIPAEIVRRQAGQTVGAAELQTLRREAHGHVAAVYAANLVELEVPVIVILIMI
jgi:hypothetical protein